MRETLLAGSTSLNPRKLLLKWGTFTLIIIVKFFVVFIEHVRRKRTKAHRIDKASYKKLSRFSETRNFVSVSLNNVVLRLCFWFNENYRDIFSVLREPNVFKILCDTLIEHVRKITPAIQYITALESRGFLFGPIISLQLGIPFAPIRKKGKLPGKLNSVSYKLEYGEVNILLPINFYRIPYLCLS